MKNFNGLLAAIMVLFSASGCAQQSSPGFVYGQVPTPTQWNSYFSGKLDYNASGLPVNLGGTGMTVPGASGHVLTSNGTIWTSAAPATSGTVSSVSVSSANGFGGTVATATTTPAITLTTSITGLLKGNGTAISAAAAGTDYLAPPSGTALQKANNGGALVAASVGIDYAGPTPGGVGSILLNNGSGGFSLYTGATPCTNQFFTGFSGLGVSTCTTATLASAQFANQGTTTTVLHGNAAGNPAWGAVSLTTDVSGTLQGAQWPTLTANAFLTGGGATTQPNAVALTGIIVGHGASAPTAASSTVPTGTTGTGKVVLDTAPTMGAVTAASVTADGLVVTAGNNITTPQVSLSDSINTPSTTVLFANGSVIAGSSSFTWASSTLTEPTNNAATAYKLNGVLLASSTAPTIASGFGSSPSIPANNGTAAFTINVGTGGSASSGVITMPAATTGWSCGVTPNGAPQAAAVTYSAPTSTTSITLTNYTLTTGTTLAWTASTVLAVRCIGY